MSADLHSQLLGKTVNTKDGSFEIVLHNQGLGLRNVEHGTVRGTTFEEIHRLLREHSPVAQTLHPAIPSPEFRTNGMGVYYYDRPYTVTQNEFGLWELTPHSSYASMPPIPFQEVSPAQLSRNKAQEPRATSDLAQLLGLQIGEMARMTLPRILRSGKAPMPAAQWHVRRTSKGFIFDAGAGEILDLPMRDFLQLQADAQSPAKNIGKGQIVHMRDGTAALVEVEHRFTVDPSARPTQDIIAGSWRVERAGDSFTFIKGIDRHTLPLQRVLAIFGDTGEATPNTPIVPAVGKQLIYRKHRYEFRRAPEGWWFLYPLDDGQKPIRWSEVDGGKRREK